MSEWISVYDRLPIEQDYQSSYLTTNVIVTDGVSVSVATYAIGGNHIGKPWGDFVSDENPHIGYYSHWMPLPEPPKN
ncbi:MAG: DUF551 domain-containing protein [Shewanella sp.]